MLHKWIAFVGITVLLSGCSSGNNQVFPQDDAVSYIWNTDADVYSYGQAPDNSVRSGEYADEEFDMGTNEYSSEKQMRGYENNNRSSVCFTLNTDSVEAEDGTTLLFQSYDSVEFNADDPELNEWGKSVFRNIEQEYHQKNAHLLESAQIRYRDYKETFYSYSNYLNMGIARHDKNAMSILAVNSMHSGGAHPITLQYAYNLDMVNRKRLTLEDIIIPTATEKLADLIKEGLRKDFEQLGTDSLNANYETTIQDLMKYGSMTTNWYFNDDSLVIFFNQYEIALYAAGIIKVEIPYTRLEGIVKDSYFPQPYSKKSSNLIVRDDSNGLSLTSVNLGEGDTVLIGTDDVVYQLQLSEISWLDNTPVYKRMILSMNELTIEDVVEITGVTKKEGMSYAVEFRNGVGEHKVYYIHTDGLADVP